MIAHATHVLIGSKNGLETGLKALLLHQVNIGTKFPIDVTMFAD